MVKPKTNYFIDWLLLICFLFTAFSALVIFFFLPSGIKQSGYQEFWGVTKRVWGDWHKWFGIGFIIIGVVHFILHIPWVTAMTKNIFSKKTTETK